MLNTSGFFSVQRGLSEKIEMQELKGIKAGKHGADYRHGFWQAVTFCMRVHLCMGICVCAGHPHTHTHPPTPPFHPPDGSGDVG